jgi:hypothetical protein
MPIVFADMEPEVFAIFIPIVSIIGGIAIAIVAIVVAGRKKELEHKERLIAMEKGIPIPDNPEARRLLRPAYQKNRTGGLVTLFLGIALSFAMWVAGGAVAGVWGLPMVGIGVGLLVASALERKEEKEGEGPSGTAGSSMG